MWSTTGRELLRHYYNVELGRYSYGTCIAPHVLAPGTKIGNYCSFAAGVNFLRRNHPVDRISQHPAFYNSEMGVVAADSIHSTRDNPLTIGHDVWIGENALIGPGCSRIGNSAIVAAGAFVSREVDDFTIVGGVPARLIRRRLSSECQKLIEQTEWWLHPLHELAPYNQYFSEGITEDAARVFHAAWKVRPRD